MCLSRSKIRNSLLCRFTATPWRTVVIFVVYRTPFFSRQRAGAATVSVFFPSIISTSTTVEVLTFIHWTPAPSSWASASTSRTAAVTISWGQTASCIFFWTSFIRSWATFHSFWRRWQTVPLWAWSASWAPWSFIWSLKASISFYRRSRSTEDTIHELLNQEVIKPQVK